MRHIQYLKLETLPKYLRVRSKIKKTSEWMVLCRRTPDPKLSYIEWRLTCLSIESRRREQEGGCPILEIHPHEYVKARHMLYSKLDTDYRDLNLMPHDHPYFQEFFKRKKKP